MTLHLKCLNLIVWLRFILFSMIFNFNDIESINYLEDIKQTFILLLPRNYLVLEFVNNLYTI